MPLPAPILPRLLTGTPRRLLLLGVGFFIVLALWFACRSYITSIYQTADNVSRHPLYLAFHDMSVALDDGQPLGTLNISRLIRNTAQDAATPYDTRRQPDDKFCLYKAVDPGYAYIVQAARHAFYFLPDNFRRAVALQSFADLALVILIFVTFLEWGVLTAVGAGALYALNPDFAFLSVTPFYNFWDGIVAAAVFLLSIWAWRLRRDGNNRIAVAIVMTTLGLVMGLGVWLRATWVVYGICILAVLLSFKSLRRVAIIAGVIFAILAGAFIIRSSALEGRFALSTRMTWHTAFQALGRYPNKYGLEDDDLYLFERAKQQHNVDYNFCDFTQQDNAMQADYRTLIHQDPGFVMQSIISRAFTNIFFNFDETWRPFWNLGVLAMAWAGLLWAIICGGDLLVLAALGAMLFMLVCLSTAPLFYIRVNYAFVTQLALVMLTAPFFQLVATTLRTPQIFTLGFWRRWRGQIFADRFNRFTLVNLIIMLTFLSAVIILMPPVQKYLRIEHAQNHSWVSPSTLSDDDITLLLNDWRQLPKAQATAFLKFVHHTMPDSHDAAADITKFATQNLRIIANYAEATGGPQRFLVPRTHANHLFEALARTAMHLLGWQLTSLNAFDVADANTWDGKTVTFVLAPQTRMPQAEFNKIMAEKFATWNWQLVENAPGHYTATHTGGGCSATRRTLSTYFNRNCD